MRVTKRQREAIKLREQRYVSHWNFDEHKKDYEALEDAYSSNFFINPTVKRHFKSFAKSTKNEPKTTDHLRITFLLSKKYQKSPNKRSKENSPSNESLNDSLIKPYENDLKPSSLSKLRKVHKIELEDLRRAQSTEGKLPQVPHKRIYASRNQESSIDKEAPKSEFDKFLRRTKKLSETRDLLRQKRVE